MTGLNDSDKKVKVWSSHLFQHKGALSQLQVLVSHFSSKLLVKIQASIGGDPISTQQIWP